MINFIISGRGENQRFQRNWKLLSKICSCNNNRRWGDGKKIFVCDIFEIVHCLCFINWWPFIWWEMKMDTTFNAKSMILDSMMWIAGNKMKKIDNIVIFWLGSSVNCVTFIFLFKEDQMTSKQMKMIVYSFTKGSICTKSTGMLCEMVEMLDLEWRRNNYNWLWRFVKDLEMSLKWQFCNRRCAPVKTFFKKNVFLGITKKLKKRKIAGFSNDF